MSDLADERTVPDLAETRARAPLGEWEAHSTGVVRAEATERFIMSAAAAATPSS